MALKIRLRQQGRNNRPFYRVVVADSRSPRDGKYVEGLGSYDPFKAQGNILLNAERIAYWIGQGAEVTETVQALMQSEAPAILKQKNERVIAHRANALAKRKARKKAPKKSQGLSS